MNQEIIPFHTYLWKIASRCNLACTYCYVYFSEDDNWKRQPKFMSSETAWITARKIREHLEFHKKNDASIIFHGGEPMLGGLKHIDELTTIIAESFRGSGIKLSVGMQSNLLLFDEKIGDLMLDRGMTVGVSLDGPPHINDIARVDHAGRPSSKNLETKLKLLNSSKYKELFSGILCVINPVTDPVEVTKYLLSFEPRGIDFLFPLDNHDRRPMGKTGNNLHKSPYGDWLIKSFDFWKKSNSKTKVRIFNSIMNLICGGSSDVESLGLGAVDLVVVETNGDIEGVDSLKSTFNGATTLNFNVSQNSFNEVATHIGVRSRQLGAESLCEKCQHCDLLGVCGGGYLPHRYSKEFGFLNTSVYCNDLDVLIRHLHKSIKTELMELVVPV